MEKKDRLKFALVQFDPKWEEAGQNVKKVEAMLEGLSESVDVIVLPEAFTTGFSMDAGKVAEPMDGGSVSWMKQVAANKQVAICGSLFIADNETYYNRFVWAEPSGKLFTYDKRHLFSMSTEHEHYSQGELQLLIEYKGWKIFPQICYDLRFPVWSRNVQGYDLLINVANWPGSRQEVWKTLLKARAIENQCYVVAVNRVGRDGNGISYSGDSMLIDYKGEIVLSVDGQAGIAVVGIEKPLLDSFRRKFDTLKDRDQFQLQ